VLRCAVPHEGPRGGVGAAQSTASWFVSTTVYGGHGGRCPQVRARPGCSTLADPDPPSITLWLPPAPRPSGRGVTMRSFQPPFGGRGIPRVRT
jgi:hypothetical protein